jgi:ribosome-associated protein
MSATTFTLEAEFIEVNQLLKLAGACDSGGAGKVLVAEGRVTVDGAVETRKTAKIRAGQTVVCDALRIRVVGTT